MKSRLVMAIAVLATVLAITAVVSLHAGNARRLVVVVPSDSMRPNLNYGDRVEVNEDAYRNATPRAGDVALFYAPTGATKIGGKCGAALQPHSACAAPTPERSSQRFIKRIVAGPEDRLRIRDGHAVVNGEVSEPYGVVRCHGETGCDMPREITIPQHHYFVMGDNRPESDDSRFWGPVPEAWIIGRIKD